MSLIQVQPELVKRSAIHIGKLTDLLEDEIAQLNRIRSSTSSRVLQRRDLYNRLNAVIMNIRMQIDQLKMLEIVLNGAMERYIDVDKAISKLAEQLLDQEGKNANATKNSFKDYFDDITSLAVKINNRIIDAENAYVYVTKGLLAAGSIAMVGRLKINYVGGKPTLMQKIRGDYKFTISAPNSWKKQNGKYSSFVAQKLDDFKKSTPSNPLLKKAHQFASSYRTPSDMLKHTLGFGKNVRTSVEGGKFLKSMIKASDDIGLSKTIGKVATKKGLLTLGKRIPGVNAFVSFVANAGEFGKKDRGILENSTRFLTGFATDVAFTATGAKAGAVIGGMIGGPVGIVVGGAIGGIAGAVIGTEFSGFLKDKAAETVKGISNGVGKAFKSVGSWFK